MKIALVLPLLLAVCAAAAQEDPLKSAACGSALARLEAARASKATAATIEALRGTAAATCLGSGAPPTRPGRTAQAPVVVPPPQVELPARAVPLPAPAPPPPPVAIERAPLPATCDASGCWTNDGTHLRHIPPTLVGPNGPCTQQGLQVYCP